MWIVQYGQGAAAVMCTGQHRVAGAEGLHSSRPDWLTLPTASAHDMLTPGVRNATLVC
jgi:hypothetical protein